MKSRERTIYFYDVHINATTRKEGIENPPCIPFLAAAKVIASLDLKGEHGAFKKGPDELFQIQDFAFDTASGSLELLINHADKSLSDPVFKHFVSRRTRNAGKDKIEGIDISTHALLIPSATSPSSALLLLTYGSGVTAAFMEKMLSKLMVTAASIPKHKNYFQLKHPSGEVGATYNVKYVFECVGHKSQRLREDLATGQLQGVELTANQIGGIDTGGSFVSVAQSLSLKPLSNLKPSLATLMQAIGLAKQSTGKDFDSVRVRFKDANDNLREEVFATNDLEAAFVKKERLKFDTDIPSQHIFINRGIMDAMRALCN
jgi:hypothetical protein